MGQTAKKGKRLKCLPVWKVTVGNVGNGGWLIFKTDPLLLDPACRELAASTLAADDVDAPVRRRCLQKTTKKLNKFRTKKNQHKKSRHFHTKTYII